MSDGTGTNRAAGKSLPEGFLPWLIVGLFAVACFALRAELT